MKNAQFSKFRLKCLLHGGDMGLFMALYQKILMREIELK